MGYFAYKFIGRTPEIDATRRSASDWYANLAQLSQLFLILVIAYGKFVAVILLKLFQNTNNSNSNVKAVKRSIQESSSGDGVLGLSRTARCLKSKLGRDVVNGYGTYEQWIFGLGWTAWLSFLCIKDTTPGT